MTTRLASVALVLGAALADAAGQHSLAYYSLVAAVPMVALAALNGLGDVLDGSAAQPHDRGIAVLSAVALPFVLLGTAVRAPLLEDGPPPVIGITAVVGALARSHSRCCHQRLDGEDRERLRTAFRRG